MNKMSDETAAERSQSAEEATLSDNVPAAAPMEMADEEAVAARVAPGRMMKREHAKGMAPPPPLSKPMPSVAPPVDVEPPSNEKYEDHGVNPWTETAKDKLSTFAVDVDTGSYTIARKKLMEQEQMPDPASVRVEEFVNYFRYDYPNPDSTFGVYAEVAPSPFASAPNRYLARIGVQGKRLEAKTRKAIHLTFLVDVSGSMNAPDKLPLAVDALKVLVNNLKPGDTVAIATYAGYVAEVLKPTGAANKGAIFTALDSLGAGGGTGMNDGMKIAYELAMSKKKGGEVSRVIVLSDGDANIGPMSHNDILAGIKKYVDEGVTLSTIGLGTGNYNDKMMEQLANKGNGNYYYIDSIQEARKVFGEQLDGTLQVIAKDVKLQVEFDPVKVPRYRLLGYENRNIADKDFRNDAVDAGEIGAGHTVTALYELELAGAAEGTVATVRVRHKKPDAFKATEDAFPLTDGHFHAKLGQASSDFQFAAAVAAFAELLRKSPHATTLNYAWISEIASASSTPAQTDRQEFLAMLRAAQKFAN
jgi:Ca-activated chloride channel family protein